MTKPLFFQRRFWPLWTTLAFGAFTDNMLRQALMIGIAYGWVGHGAVGEGAVPLIGSILAIAILVFSSLAGQLAEKYETSLMLRRTKLLEVVIVGVVAVGFAIDSAALLIVALFALGAQSALFSPARISAMPKYLQADELVRGNGLCNAGLYVFILLGIFFGGLLVAREGGGLFVAAVMIISALIGYGAARQAPTAPPGAPDLALDANPFAQMAQMARLVAAAKGVGAPMLGAAFFYYTTTLITVLTPLFAKNALGATEAVANAIMGLFAIGAGAGGVLAAGLSRGRSGLGFSTLGMATATFASLVVFAATALPASEAPRGLDFLFGTPQGLLAATTFIVAAASMGLFVVPLQAAMQRRAPPQSRARLMAAGNMANAFAAMLGSLSVMAVTHFGLSHRDAFLVIAGLQAAAAVIMLRRRAALPAGLHDEILARAKSGAATVGAG